MKHPVYVNAYCLLKFGGFQFLKKNLRYARAFISWAKAPALYVTMSQEVEEVEVEVHF